MRTLQCHGQIVFYLSFIKLKNILHQILKETLIMVRMVLKEPTKALLLVLKELDVIIFTNTSLRGIVGMVYYAINSYLLLVFRIPFLEEIKQSIITTMKGDKEVLISDREALALVAGLLIALIFLHLEGKLVALFCDKTLTVR